LQSRLKEEQAFILQANKFYLGMNSELQPIFKSQQAYSSGLAYSQALKDLSKTISEGNISDTELNEKIKSLNEQRSDLIKSYNPLAKFVEDSKKISGIVDQISTVKLEDRSAKSPVIQDQQIFNTGSSSSRAQNILTSHHAYDSSDVQDLSKKEYLSRYQKLLSNDLRKIQEIKKQIDKQDSKLSEKFIIENKEKVEKLESELRLGLRLLKEDQINPEVKEQLIKNNQEIKSLQSSIFSSESLPELKLLSKTVADQALDQIKSSPKIEKLFEVTDLLLSRVYRTMEGTYSKEE